MPVRRDDPYASFNFLVEIDGVEAAGFSEVSIGEARVEPIEYREGADRTSAARLLPGRASYGPVVLKRGFAGDASLAQWWQALAQGQLDRRAVAIVLLDESRQPVARWTLRRAWPSKLVAPTLHARGNEVAIETLELVHEGLELE